MFSHTREMENMFFSPITIHSRNGMQLFGLLYCLEDSIGYKIWGKTRGKVEYRRKPSREFLSAFLPNPSEKFGLADSLDSCQSPVLMEASLPPPAQTHSDTELRNSVSTNQTAST